MRQIILFLVSIFGAVVFLSVQIAGADGEQTEFYCLDMSCHDIISFGKTLLVYTGKTEKHLSFKKNDDIAIISKPTKGGDDWVGKVGSKVGVVPKSMVREDRMSKRAHKEIYKYPLHALPVWTALLDEPEEESKNVEEIDPIDSSGDGDDATEMEDEGGEDEETSSEDASNEDTTPDSSSVDTEKGIDPSVEEPPILEETISEALSGEATIPQNVSNEEVTSPDPLPVEEKISAEPVIESKASPESLLGEQETKNEPTSIEEEETATSEPPPVGETSTSEPISSEEAATSSPEVATTPAPVTEAVTSEAQPSTSSGEGLDPESVSLDEVVTPEPQPVEEIILPDSLSAANEVVTPPEPVSVEEATTPASVPLEEAVETTATQVPPFYVKESTPVPLPVVAPLKQEPVPVKLTVPVKPPVLVKPPVPVKLPVTQQPIPTAATTPQEPLPVKEEVASKEPISVEEPVTASPDPSPIEKTLTPEFLQVKEEKSDPLPVEKISTPEQEPLVEEIAPVYPPPAKEIVPESVHVEQITTSEPPPVEEETTATPEYPPIEEAKIIEPILVDAATSPATPFMEEVSPLAPISIVEPILPISSHEQENTQKEAEDPKEEGHNHDHGHEHDHSHKHHFHNNNSNQNETSSIILVVKHLSSTLLTFLPEHLQDTILDVDDALVFTGIIALTLVSICVPYFFIEGFLSVQPLKKKVVELNKSLWKVSTAYENQQEEFEIFKKKALEYDEDKNRVEQLEAELAIVKNLEGKQKDQVKNLKKELKSSAKIATEVENLVESTMKEKTKAVEERDRLKTVVLTLEEALNKTTEELEIAQAELSTFSIDLQLSNHATETTTLKLQATENEMFELKAKLATELETRQKAVEDCDTLTNEKSALEEELIDLKKILHQYEETVSNLNTEISHKENELMALKENLGEDSPIVDIAETKAKLMYVQEETLSLQSRIDSITIENNSLNRDLQDTKKSLNTVQGERDFASNRLGVLEAYFKEKEEELRTVVGKLEAERSVRGKDKDDLVKMIEEKADEVRDLGERLEALKDEFEETKLMHRNEIRAMEAKSHENWLSLCQAERKAQDCRKDAELLRQKLTAITKEKEGDEGEMQNTNGEVPFYSMLPPELVPLPIQDIPPSYFGLGDDFLPPPPLPVDGEREPMRPPPLGRLSPTWNSDLEDNPLSPIRRRGRGRDYSDGSSRSGSRSPPRGPPSSRGNWSERDRDRLPHHDLVRRDDLPGSSHGHVTHNPGPKTSSPIQFGANL